jgi:hypothetical protein
MNIFLTKFINTMPKKRKRTHQAGKGPIKDFLGKVHDFVKKHKVISTVANIIPHPYARAVGTVANLAGYGKRRPGRPRKRGRKKK